MLKKSTGRGVPSTLVATKLNFIPLMSTCISSGKPFISLKVKSVLISLNLLKSTPDKLTPFKLASVKSAPAKLVLRRIAPFSFVFLRLAPFKLAPVKSIPVRSW